MEQFFKNSPFVFLATVGLGGGLILGLFTTLAFLLIFGIDQQELAGSEGVAMMTIWFIGHLFKVALLVLQE